MPNFCCKHCGMITDEPEIVSHPDKDVIYRDKKDFASIMKSRYNHSITCPVCQNETRFWRDEPFPTGKNDNIDLENIPSRVI